MEIDPLDQVKKLTIIAMFSDDDLMETLVLKGGNALDIVYKVADRASLDLDFSMSDEIANTEINFTKNKIEDSLRRVFGENGYTAFDIKFGPKPEFAGPRVPAFWGGYELEFKIIKKDKYETHRADVEDLRRNAEIVGPKNRKNFRVQISKYEYCKTKTKHEIDGYTIYVYTPEMIVFEKLRAICQQTDEYAQTIGRSHQEGRARDFFDIYTVVEKFNVDVTAPSNIKLLENIFSAKSVPVQLLFLIKNYREQHRPDFAAVKDTVRPGIKIKGFDYYFDYVVNICDLFAKAFGEI